MSVTPPLRLLTAPAVALTATDVTVELVDPDTGDRSELVARLLTGPQLGDPVDVLLGPFGAVALAAGAGAAGPATIAGTVPVPFANATNATASVTFPPGTFAGTPVVVAQLRSAAGTVVKGTVLVTASSATGATFRVDLPAAATVTPNVNYLAAELTAARLDDVEQLPAPPA